MRNITIIGAGYVGLVTGVCLAEMGNQVICHDIDQEKIKSLKQGLVPFYEPDLDGLLKKNIDEGQIIFSGNLEQSFKKAEIIFICVGTPPKEDGSADMSAYFQVIDSIKDVLAKKTDYNLNPIIIINKSTVPIGTAEQAYKLLSETVLTDNFAVVSNPEFLREGKAVGDFMNPERIVLGFGAAGIGQDILFDLYSSLSCPKLTTNWESAEMIKYAANSFLAVKISFINEIANLCEEYSADVKTVAEGIGLDSRIGRKFLRAGIGYGGSCFPKDIDALFKFANDQKYSFKLLKAVIDVNIRQRELAVTKIKKMLGGNLKNKTIAVLGLSFKPDTDDTRESPGIFIIKELLNKGVRIQAFDPAASDNARKDLEGITNVNITKNAIDAIKDSDLVFLATEWPEFLALNWSQVKEVMRGDGILDGRNALNKEELENLGFQYKGFGI